MINLTKNYISKRKNEIGVQKGKGFFSFCFSGAFKLVLIVLVLDLGA